MHASELQRVVATVSVEPAEQREAVLDYVDDHLDDRAYKDRLAANLRSTQKLRLQVTLSAEDANGQLISTGRVDFRLGLQRRGVAVTFFQNTTLFIAFLALTGFWFIGQGVNDLLLRRHRGENIRAAE